MTWASTSQLKPSASGCHWGLMGFRCRTAASIGSQIASLTSRAKILSLDIKTGRESAGEVTWTRLPSNAACTTGVARGDGRVQHSTRAHRRRAPERRLEREEHDRDGIDDERQDPLERVRPLEVVRQEDGEDGEGEDPEAAAEVGAVASEKEDRDYEYRGQALALHL